ncbi:MAG: hypothetical protein ACRD4M_10340 [Candidatus Acidiferrales bacterium]
MASLGVVGGALLGGLPTAAKMTSFPALFRDGDEDRDDRRADTAQEIFTAALIAEDLAITMYYNSLIGGVIQDPNLAGPGGNLSNPDNLANVGYLQGALSEEIVHANLLRTLIGGSNSSSDPVQTFFFPTGTFDNLQNFFPILLALETAFIGAYLTAVQEFSSMAAEIEPFERRQLDSSGKPYSHKELAYFAKVAASILGVEAEHRTLARAIPSITPGNTTFAGTDIFPADNVNFEQTDGLESVYKGFKSAVVALTPFITNGSGKTSFSYATAIANANKVSVPTTGGLPQQ